MSDIQENPKLIKARQEFQRKQLEFNKEDCKLRIMELEDQIEKYKNNIKATDLAIAELGE